jgi:hypothetical protein
MPARRREYQRKHMLVLCPGNSFEEFFIDGQSANITKSANYADDDNN